MPIDPVSGGAALAALIMQQYNEGKAADTAKEGLDFQRQNAADALRFAKASRVDPYGNRTSYDDALNQWITQLTPEQQSLLSAGEHEQRLGLTEDATRNRAIREQQYRRGQQAEEDYNTARAGYKYGAPRSEGALMSDITNLMTQARGQGDRALNTLVNRQDLRQSGNMPVINTGSILSADPGQRLAQTMLQARQQALSESGQREQQRQNEFFPMINMSRQTADMGSSGPIQLPSTAGDITNQQGDMAKMIASAMQSGGAGVGGAFANLSKIQQGADPDLKGIASLIQSMKQGGTNPGKSVVPNPTYGFTF